MRSSELKPVSKEKIGRVLRNGVKTDPLEDRTILFLTQLGFDIELIIPSSTEKANNPDILMLGTIWEIKNPETNNSKTIKKRFHKASKQASKLIFDLRSVKHNVDSVESELIELFIGNKSVNRMIIIRKNEKTMDFLK